MWRFRCNPTLVKNETQLFVTVNSPSCSTQARRAVHLQVLCPRCTPVLLASGKNSVFGDSELPVLYYPGEKISAPQRWCAQDAPSSFSLVENHLLAVQSLFCWRSGGWSEGWRRKRCHSLLCNVTLQMQSSSGSRMELSPWWQWTPCVVVPRREEQCTSKVMCPRCTLVPLVGWESPSGCPIPVLLAQRWVKKRVKKKKVSQGSRSTNSSAPPGLIPEMRGSGWLVTVSWSSPKLAGGSWLQEPVGWEVPSW